MDDFSYTLGDNENGLELFQTNYSNFNNVIKLDKNNQKLILSNECLKDYFLLYKDALSYNFNRFLKNNEIKNGNILDLRLFVNQTFLVFSLELENSVCVFIKDIKNDRYFKHYFVDIFENYWIVEFPNRTLFIFQNYHSSHLFYFELKSEDFVGDFSKNIKVVSLTAFMRENQENLFNNDFGEFLEKNAKNFFEEKIDKLDFNFFGKTNFFKTFNSEKNEYKLFYIYNGVLLNVFVT